MNATLRRGRWSEVAAELGAIKEQLTELNRENKRLTQELKTLSKGMTSRDKDYLFKMESRPGKVAWDLLCELEGIDKEEYRKEDEEVWRLLKL
jgi:regulator of replication initiation timing